MNRNSRTLIVVVIAVATAGLASFGVYRAVKSMPVREVEVAHTFVVAATHALPAGARVTDADVKLVAWPSSAKLPGAFEKLEQVVNRGVVSALLENEPLSETKLAPLEAGAGLPPTIPTGMRAISVRVNEVVGVAGFVTPGTRVDVLVTLKQQDQTSVTRVVVGNVTVLTAGTSYAQDKSKPAEAMPSSVVTLLLAPSDAERVVLASNDGQIMLSLRNPMDVEPTTTPGSKTATLFGEPFLVPPPAPTPAIDKSVRVAPRPVRVVAPPPVVVPPAPVRYSVEAIRGAKRSEETLQ
ncbi:MAG: Flp pilus assembly protein CpaB [Vicinamibacterales bacterium]